MPTIYEVLKKDHDSHREVLKRLDATSGDSPEREELYATMKQEVEAHTAAEEETFYATLMARPEGQARRPGEGAPKRQRTQGGRRLARRA